MNDVLERLAKDFPLRSSDQAADEPPRLLEPIDTNCQNILNAVRGPTHDPLDVETLLDDVIDKVSRCEAIRTQAQELEIRAVITALECSGGKQLETSVTDLQKLDAASGAARTSAMEWLGLRIEHGFLVRDAGADKNGDLWTKQREILGRQLGTLQDRIQAFQTLASDHGSGGNFAERFEFLRSLFAEFLRDGYSRALSAARGLEIVYGIKHPVPAVVNQGYLSQLVLWANEAASLLDAELEERYFGTLCLAVAAPTEAAATPGELELVPRADFDAAVGTGNLTFELTDRPFQWAGMREPRLRGIELRFLKGDLPLPRFWTCRVTLPGYADRGNKITLTHIAVGSSVSSEEPRPPLRMRSVHNANPVGQWNLRFSRPAVGGPAMVKLAKEELTNILLFLRVAHRRS